MLYTIKSQTFQNSSLCLVFFYIFYFCKKKHTVNFSVICGVNKRRMKKFANLNDIKDECRENTTLTCSCKRKNPCVAYDSLGILKCPEQDAVFYMENFLEVIIEFYGAIDA